jgi:hypothetical protein
MHLIYFDESGNSGANLKDPSQPVFVLGTLIVPEERWQALERSLEDNYKAHFPELHAKGCEIHGSALRNGEVPFKGVDRSLRDALRDDWFKIAQLHQLKFTYRAIHKKYYEKAMQELFEGLPPINPHIPAFALLATCINDYLADQKSLGIFISDECRGIDGIIEKAIQQFRLTPGSLQLTQIIEKGFFIDSAKSRILQLCDVCTLYAKKKEELKIGIVTPSEAGAASDRAGAANLEPLIHVTKERLFWDVMEWLKVVGPTSK